MSAALAAYMAHSRIADTAYSEFDQINWIATQRLAHAAKEAAIDRHLDEIMPME